MPRRCCCAFIAMLACLVVSTVRSQQETADDPREAKFNALDKDNDGRLSAEELTNKKAFDKLDRNGDGFVTREEAKLGIERKRPRQPQKAAPAEALPDELQPLTEPLRDLDPVELTGAQLKPLIGRKPDEIVAFRFADKWQRIPVQVDERVERPLGRGRSGVDTGAVALFYADDKLGLGADTDPQFDADDELTFMFHDTGERTTADDPNGAIAGTRLELPIGDPLTKSVGYVYLFATDGSLRPDTRRDYVRYDFKLTEGEIHRGTQHEDSWLRTERYENHFSRRWIHDGTRILAGDATGVDVLDRHKFQFKPGICGRTTDTFSSSDGPYIANIDGPVRAIRSVMRANSGKLTQRDYIAYAGRMTVRTYLRVHPIGGTWDFYDFSPEATGMTYYDNLNLDGVTVDGKPDDIKSGHLRWQFVTGKQGSLTMAAKVDTNIAGINWHSYYFDDTQPDWNQCTGDKLAYAASGLATGFLPNTDAGSDLYYVANRIVYYDAPEMTVEQAQARVTAAWFPLELKTEAAQ